MIRSPSIKDFRQVMELYKQNESTYQFDPFRSNTILDDAVVLNKKEEIIAYGMIKIFAEAVLVLDHNASRFDKAKALIDLMNVAVKQTKNRGISQLYTFTNDDRFNNQLIEQFGFESITSSPLVREL